MQFKVPQNIEMEDKIVGPLTLKQFVYLLCGGIIIYLSYLYFPLLAFVLIAIAVGLLVMALAFIKINDRPFINFLGSFLSFTFSSKKRTWQREQNPPHVVITKSASKEQNRTVKKYDEEKAKALAGMLHSAPTPPAGQPPAPAPTQPPVQVPPKNPTK